MPSTPAPGGKTAWPSGALGPGLAHLKPGKIHERFTSRFGALFFISSLIMEWACKRHCDILMTIVRMMRSSSECKTYMCNLMDQEIE